MEALLLLFYGIFWAYGKQLENIVNKCCYEGEILQNDFKSCVKIDGTEVSTEIMKIFDTPLSNDTMKWIPEDRRTTPLRVKYGMMHNIIYDKLNVRAYNQKGFIIQEFDLQNFFYKLEGDCIDNTQNPLHPRVVVSAMQIFVIHKCCNKYAQLNAKANECISIPGKENKASERELLNHIPSPHNQSSFFIGQKFFFLDYNFLHQGYNLNRVHIFPNDIYFLYFGSSFYNFEGVEYTGRDLQGNIMRVKTDAFCFDTVDAGPHVMLAAVYNMYKCCSKGKYINPSFGGCLTRSGMNVEHVKNEIIQWKESDFTKDWIPKALRNYTNSVRYNAIEAVNFNFGQDNSLSVRLIIYNEDIWKVLMASDGTITLSGSIPLISGDIFRYTTHHFCFDTIQDNVKVILLNDVIPVNEILPFPKCCFPGKALSVDGFCVQHIGQDWGPGLTDKRFFGIVGSRSLVANSTIHLSVESHCYNIRYSSISSLTSLSDENRQVGVKTDSWGVTGYCADFQLLSGVVEQVVASCTFPPSVNTYKSVRPLGSVSAVLLVGAAVVVVARDETRRTAHGRALVAHALCLAAAGTIQVTWFFYGSTYSSYYTYCPQYGYPTYFFMIAANWWLSAITINMMNNFRRPLGAMARGAGGGTSPSAVWRRFGVMSAFAWGGSLAMTIFVIILHIYRKEMHENGIVPPSFFETRTCALELPEYLRQQGKGDSVFSNRLGALFYYYIPMALLAAVNAVCTVLTILSVHKLGQDSAFASASSKSTFKNVSLYVKLMLTTGIMELLLEVVAWSVSQSLTINQQYELHKSLDNIYVFGILSTFLELLRAMLLFWLCLGPWCNITVWWKAFLKVMAIFVYWRGIVQRMSGMWERIRRSRGAKHKVIQETLMTPVSPRADK